MRPLLVLLPLWVACDAARPATPPSRSAPPAAPVVMPADAALAAIADASTVDPWLVREVPAAPAPPAVPPGSTAAWKRDVAALASANARYVVGWGTVRLDGAHPIRFATLAPHGYGAERGAYVLELAPHHVVELTFYFDGRTSMFAGGDGVETPVEQVEWQVSDAVAISHDTGHHHGGESLELALRDGELVLLSYTYTDDVTDKSEQPIEHAFPRDFACRPGCPLAATYHSYWGSQLAVSKPARSAADLVEPPPPALPDAFP
jgi:hypothetical protein